MKVYIAIFSSVFLFISVQSLPSRSSYSTSTKVSDAKSVNQTKRDLSLSYAATDIDSKEGSRVKTITVIKNVGNQNKHQPLAINQELHKNEEWASAFRDNFDSYGKIPDVPDIDDLFDFVNKKKSEDDGQEKEATEAPKPNEVEKPVHEASAELKGSPVADDEGPVEKIKGDAEIIPSSSSRKQTPMSRSQSLSIEKYRVREPMIDVNYSTPHHSVRQYFDKYVQATPNSNLGYDYPKPCVHASPGSITVTTPSGRTYDIPVDNNSNDGKRYIAPAISKKTQVQPQSNQQPVNTSGNQPNYSVNSLIPPQTSQASQAVGNSLPSNTTPQLQGAGFSTTQRAYVAPRLRNGFSTSLGPPTISVYRLGSPKFRTNVFGAGVAIRPNYARSRGLKY